MASIVYHPDSSNIAAVSWNNEVFSFGVEFKNGVRYGSRQAMPKSVIVDWVAAESAGKFFHERIKGVYELEEVQDGI